MKKKRHFLRRVISAVLCAALTAGLMIVPSSANNLDDNLDSKASQACARFGLVNGGEIKEGSKRGQYQLNARFPSTGRDLYVIQAHTTTTCDGKIYVSLYYEGSDGKLHYTEEVDFDKATEDYLGVDDGFRAGQNNAMSILLPHTARRILGVYLYKNKTGKDKLVIDTLTVSKVTGTIKAISGDGAAERFRDFQGSYVAYTADMTTYIKDTNELNSTRENTGAIAYTQSVPEGQHNAALAQYIVELVAEGDGYVNKNGTVTVNYTDTLGLTTSRSIRFREGYADLQLNKHVQEADTDYNHTITSGWFQTSVREMQGLASGYVGNYYIYQDVSETCLRPYTGTGLRLIMPQNISKINSITIKLDESDSLILQSARLIKLSYFGNEDNNYWNGGFSLERTRSWSGELLAKSTGGPYTINGRSSITFTADQGFEQRGLENYAEGDRLFVDNTGTKVGVTIQIADLQGAGIDFFLAYNAKSNGKPNFNAASQLEERAGKDARNAWYNLNIFRKECMNLKIKYKDVVGDTRVVEIPLLTTYLVYLLKENQGKLTGGDWTTWISGIFQQNENVALPIRLAEYASLEEITFTYGSAPYGFTSTDSGTVNTTKDTLTIENICFYEGVTENNFNSKYDAKKLACVLNTTLTPAYSYSAASSQGQQLARGASINASLAGGTLVQGPAAARDYTDKYLVRIKTADIETAGTKNPISISMNYTDSSGAERNTATYSIPTLAAGYYGYTARKQPAEKNNKIPDGTILPAEHQYERHMRRNCLCEFVMELPGAVSINSATLSIDGTNEWQMEYINVYKLERLEQRYGERSENSDDDNGVQLYWRRESTGTQVASVRASVLLYSNNPTRTLNFTTYSSDGTAIEPEQTTKTEEYLTSLPESMTYNDTKKNLGLSIVKYSYQLDVEVANVEDAGSTNYFYFQLLFENGTSGVVLANQQLSSDSFRQGMVESFLIKTTQNYGNVLAVRIICDNTSSQTNVFDKLNIDNITITMKSNNGISKSWIVERVGWIDITYVDEGTNAIVDGLEDLVDTTSNIDVVKEFAVTRQATAVDLLFCIATSNSSAEDKANTLENALRGKFEATLVYRDSSGMEKSQNFDLTAKIQEYNDTDKTFWLYRNNHVDRFTLSMPDVTSVIAMIITRTGGKATWVVDNVSIQQIGGLGEVYLSPTTTEYIRDASNTTDLAVSTNSNGISYSISGNGNATITFTENSIDISSREEQDSWSASISRVPVLTNESLNIYLLPGSVIGTNYQFTASSPPVQATVKYTTIYGGSLVQNSFTLGNLGEINGQTVLYGKNLEVSAMSSLSSLVLGSASPTASNQPYIGSAIVERSRGGVLMGTYYFNFGNYYLGNGSAEFSPTTTMSSTPMMQTLRLQPSSDQMVSLTAETNDLAVALRYTSMLDPAENKTVYQSPYVYFTDAGYAAVKTGTFVDIPFSLSNVDEIVGLCIASTGPVITFDNALIRNYSVTATEGEEGEIIETAADHLLGTCGLAQTFTATTMPTNYTSNGQIVTPAVFRFTTAPEAANAAAGTSNKVSMTVYYSDATGGQNSMRFDDLLSSLPADVSPVPDSVIEIPVQLSDAAYLNFITLSAEDSWLLSSVSADLTMPDGSITSASTSVNNWAKITAPLTIDLLSPLYGGTGEGNQIQTFTVTGRGQYTQIASSASATANSGGSLLVTAYEGDTVDLTPVVSAIGQPDTTWTWNIADKFKSYLSVRDDGTATFSVPSSMVPGDNCTFSVACNGDQRLAVSVTIAVEKEPEPEPEPDLGYFDFGDDYGGDVGGDTGENDLG